MDIRYVVDAKGKLLQVLLSVKDYARLLRQANNAEALADLRRMRKELPRRTRAEEDR